MFRKVCKRRQPEFDYQHSFLTTHPCKLCSGKGAPVAFDSPTSLKQAAFAQTERKPAPRPATALQERDAPSTPEARPATAGAERQEAQAGSKTAPRPILRRGKEHRDPAGVAAAPVEFEKDTTSLAEMLGGTRQRPWSRGVERCCRRDSCRHTIAACTLCGFCAIGSALQEGVMSPHHGCLYWLSLLHDM